MAIAYFVLVLSLLVAALLIGRWFVDADPKVVAKSMRWILIALAVILLLVLIFTRRWLLALTLAFFFLPFLLRSRALWKRMKAAGGPTPGRASEITTRFLKMTLDHDSGVMTGEVLDGRFMGRRLEDLELAEQIELWRECRLHDRQSASVLEAYLDRTAGDPWREAAGYEGEAGSGEGSAADRGAGPMSKEEALDILGLEPGASAEDIREAHKRLMQKVHPDLGGSNYLAAKINQAKELLLGS